MDPSSTPPVSMGGTVDCPSPLRNDNSNPQQGTGGARGPAEDAKPLVKKPYNRPSLKIPPNKKDERKLFVGGLPPNATQEDFKSFFEQFGEVMDSIILVDQNTNRSRGFGFVSFESAEDSRKLMSMADPSEGTVHLEMMGKTIEVKSAQPKESLHRASKRFHHRNASEAIAKATPVPHLPYAVPMYTDPNAGPMPYPSSGDCHALSYVPYYPGAVFAGYMAPMYYAPPADEHPYPTSEVYPPSAYYQPPPFAYAHPIVQQQQQPSLQPTESPPMHVNGNVNAQDGM